MTKHKKKKLLLCLIITGETLILLILCILLFPHTKAPKGTYIIREIKTDNIAINATDAKNLGIHTGYFKFNKDGTCEIRILEDKIEGTWQTDGDGYFLEYDGLYATAQKKGKKLYIEDSNKTRYTLYNPLA